MTYFSSHLIWPAQTHSPVSVLMVVGAHSSICPGRVDLALCGKSLGRPRSPDLSCLLILSVICSLSGIYFWQTVVKIGKCLLFPVSNPKASLLLKHRPYVRARTSICVHVRSLMGEGLLGSPGDRGRLVEMPVGQGYLPAGHLDTQCQETHRRW